MKIIFFIFRYKFRRLALNNFIKINNSENYKFVDLSGPYLSWIGFLIYKLNLSKKIRFISCDGLPFLKNEKNSVNLWFGGTKDKVPKNYFSYENNYVTASTLFTQTEKLVQFYPFKIKKRKKINDPKIIIALSCKEIDDPVALKIWSKNKDKILENLLLIEDENFWRTLKLQSLEIKKKQSIYICIKTLARLELLKIVKNTFKNKCVIIGNDLKKYFPDVHKSVFKYNYLKNFYDGNICLDFLAKDGEQALYPRSIEIIENGGILFQIKTKNSKKIFEKYENILTFNSAKEMISKLENLVSNEKIQIFNDFFVKKFNTYNFNESTLKDILK